MKRWWCLSLGFVLSGGLHAQEPTCRDFPTLKTLARSAHFCGYGDDSQQLAAARVDSSLEELEGWWDFLIAGHRFPQPQPLQRVSLFVQEQGWAQGGLDGGLPALWLSPGALRDPWAQGHALAQALQASTGGFQGSPYAGWFRDSFANWLTQQRIDTAAGCVELYRRQVQIHYGSSRNRFCNWPFLEFLKERHGFPLLDSLWTRWPGSAPRDRQDVLGMIREAIGLDASGLADLWGEFSLRMAAADFANREVFLAAWERSREEKWLRLDRIELEALDIDKGRYAIPSTMAPQAYAFNVVPLHGTTDTVRIAFRGLAQAERPAWTPLLGNDPDTLPLPGSAWRWGVGIVDTSIATAPRTRFLGPFSQSPGEAVLSLGPGEAASLVVAATPFPRPLIRWDQSHRSLYRYPWMVEIRGARPEGWQAARHNPQGQPGARHGNGGGFVAATAHVDSTAWIAPQAQVLEQAQVLGTARIEDRAIVKGTATVRDRARVREWARVWGSATVRDHAEISGHAVVTDGSIRDSARVDGFATIQRRATELSGKAHLGGTAVDMAPAKLSGNVHVVGDAELWDVHASRGVFTGLVDAAAVGDPARGADLAEIPPEATRAFPATWETEATELRTGRRSGGFRLLRKGRSLEITGLPGDAGRVHALDLQGRCVGSGTASRGRAQLDLVPKGVVLVLIEGADGVLAGRTVDP